MQAFKSDINLACLKYTCTRPPHQSGFWYRPFLGCCSSQSSHLFQQAHQSGSAQWPCLCAPYTAPLEQHEWRQPARKGASWEQHAWGQPAFWEQHASWKQHAWGQSARKGASWGRQTTSHTALSSHTAVCKPCSNKLRREIILPAGIEKAGLPMLQCFLLCKFHSLKTRQRVRLLSTRKQMPRRVIYLRLDEVA